MNFKTKKSSKIKKSSVLITLTLCLAIIPDGIAVLCNITGEAKLLAYLVDVIICIAILIVKHHRFSKNMICLGLIYGVIFFSAIIHGNFELAIQNFILGLTMCLIFECWLSCRFDQFVKILCWILCIWVIINFGSIILFPKGIYQTSLYKENWVFGHKNSHTNYIMMALLLCSIQSYRKKGRITVATIIFMIISCLSLFLVDATMGFVIALAYTLYAVLFVNLRTDKYIRRFLKLLNVKSIIVVSLLLFALTLTYDNLSDSINAIIANILILFGKSTDFSGRLPIWKAAIQLIKKSPIIGYGIVDSRVFVRLSGIMGGTHSHSYILNILIMGGFICLAIHIVLYYFTISQITRSKKNQLSYLIGFVLGAYFFSGITNINFYSGFFNSLFIFSYYLLQNESKKNAISLQSRRISSATAEICKSGEKQNNSVL